MKYLLGLTTLKDFLVFKEGWLKGEIFEFEGMGKEDSYLYARRSPRNRSGVKDSDDGSLWIDRDTGKYNIVIDTGPVTGFIKNESQQGNYKLLGDNITFFNKDDPTKKVTGAFYETFEKAQKALKPEIKK